jgi:hypothetical protein
MNRRHLLLTVPGVALAGLSRAAAEQAVPPLADAATLAARAAKRYPQPVRVGDLIGRDVLQPLESQPILGRVSEIVRRPDGGLDFVIAFGGFLGFGSRPIAVPSDAMALLGEWVAVLDFTPAQLATFPTADLGAFTPLPADTTIRVGLTKPFH